MSKVFCKEIFTLCQKAVFEYKITFVRKAVVHTTILIHCKPGQILRNLFSFIQGNGSEMTFVVGAKKSSSQI